MDASFNCILAGFMKWESRVSNGLIGFKATARLIQCLVAEPPKEQFDLYNKQIDKRLQTNGNVAHTLCGPNQLN